MSAAAKHPQVMPESANRKVHCRVALPCASWCFRGPALWRPRRADWRYCPCCRHASACRSPSSPAHCPAHRARLSNVDYVRLISFGGIAVEQDDGNKLSGSGSSLHKQSREVVGASWIFLSLFEVPKGKTS